MSVPLYPSMVGSGYLPLRLAILSFSRLAVPPHIHSRGLSGPLTFLWLSPYYVRTIGFILTRFTNVTLTTLLSACVREFYGFDLARIEWCLEGVRGIPAPEISRTLFCWGFFPLPSATTGGSDPNTRLHGTITNKHINIDETTQKVTMLVWNKRTHSTPTPGKSDAFSDTVRCFWFMFHRALSLI